MEPQIGEYWYISVTTDVREEGKLLYTYKKHHLALCIQSLPNDYVFKKWNSLYGIKKGYSCTLICKWEPNWLWKCLGYK